MAYAAVKSLVHTIRGLVCSSRISTGSTTRKNLESALDHAKSLEDTLYSCRVKVAESDEQIIIEESRKLEDAIQFPLSAHDHHFIHGAFHQLREDVACFSETAKKMEEKYIEEQPSPEEEDEDEDEDDDEDEDEDDDSSMVGLSDEFLQIRYNLLNGSKEPANIFNIMIWISGMAGIGKTRLAKKLFDDPSIKARFKCRAFVLMGRHYVAFDSENNIIEGDFETFWKLLNHERKSFIVFDDVREKNASFYLIRHITHEYKGSRVLVTSRMDADMNSTSFSLVLKMRFLNEEESWELLKRKVFGEEGEDCPRELVKAGKKIAEECEGLPLLIIAVAPILLSKAQKNPEAWERVAEKPDSVLEEASLQISEVLLSNYYQLSDEDLKLCFLYTTAFPKKYVFLGTNIGYLWYVEGFIYSWETKTIPHLYSLLENNLVMGHERGDIGCTSNLYKAAIGCSGDLYKACSLHSAYWYVSRRVAKNNKFLYTMKSLDDGLDELIKGHRRLAVYTNVLLAIKEVHDSMASISTVRSLLCTGPYHPYQVPICLEYWKVLRVLDALTIRFYEFPVEVVKLICLKYMSLTCNANLPPSISGLWNLQFLIVHQHWSIKQVGVVSYLPVEIWDLQELELLQVIGKNLPDPPTPGVVLPKLRKLLDVGVESCTKGVLESLPVLKKLRVRIELAPHAAETMSCFDHLSSINELCPLSLQIVVVNPTILHPPPPLTISIYFIVSLSLSGCGYPWEDMMSMIGHLPKLKKLKLKCYAFRGGKWESQMSLPHLTCLYIEDTDLMLWTASDDTFPRLSRLIMKNCHKLQGIPLFSTTDGVEIELVDCNPSAEACTKQMYSAHDDKRFKVTASYSWKKEEKKLESR